MGKALGSFAIDLVLAIVIGVGLMMAAGMGWGVIEGVRLAMAGARPEDITGAIGQPGAITQLAITMIGMGGTATLLYLWRAPADASERRRSIAALAQARTWIWVGAVSLGVFVFSSTMSWLGQRAGIPPNPSNLALITEAFRDAPWFVGLFGIVLAPLYEEILFRRVLFGRLWKAGHPMTGLILSGVVFALAHEVPGLSGNGVGATALLLTVYALMGMAFAWVYRRTGSIWAAFAAHALNNALAMAMLSVSAP